jgi:deoxyribodipyrimidine photo-lyase
MGDLSIFWFRRDLRLHDNHALFEALSATNKVLPIFIFDSNILNELPPNDSRLNFIYNTLQSLNNGLSKNHKSGVAMYFGDPEEIFLRITKQFKITAVYANHDYEPYARQRDQKIKTILNKQEINFYTFKDQVIFEKSEVVKADGKPYEVFTPYMRKWKANFTNTNLSKHPSEDLLENLFKQPSLPNLTLKEIGFETTDLKIADYKLDADLINSYEETRNFPGLDSTSRLGPHLRFGRVSIREMVKQALAQENETFLSELIWREFFMHILWHHPRTTYEAFRAKYDRIIWRNDSTEFERWKSGATGYPLVDAGMRQLNETGFMHNRVRMLVGSFLCKHLLIDWRWGEAYFAIKLHDYELSSNVGNWQWVAGCGVDAAPYFRIFNPTTQIQKFDKNLSYIKKWVPDLQELSYPSPMVDHKFARARCLEVYKAALS